MPLPPVAGPATPTHPLDRWLPDYQFVEHHATTVRTDARHCLDLAQAVDPADDPWIQVAMALREAPGRLLERLGLRGALSQRPRFGLADFTPLGRDGDRSLCYGLIGQFWRADYGLRPQATASDWAAFAEPGVVKLALSFHTEALDANTTRLFTTTRVHCPDADSRRHFAPYWWLIRPVSGLIRRRLLARVRQAAEPLGR